MTNLLANWLAFLACLVLIGYSGSKLSVYGDAIADKTGMGGTWVGLILMAIVTSLPELATGTSSVTLAGTPDIAMGDILGSCVFNLVLIVVLDFLHRGESVFTRASQGHILSAGFGVVLLGLAGFSLLQAQTGQDWRIGHVGLYTPVIFVMYLIAIRTIWRYEAQQIGAYAEKEPDRYPELSLRQAIVRYALAALTVVLAGVWLPFVAQDIAQHMGWQESFVGTLFVAFITSLPELVVTLSALRIGALDMAIGNLFGSNLFNMLILTIDDLLYLPGAILSHVSLSHSVSAFSAIVMTGIAIIGLLYRPKTRVFKAVGWTSIFLLSIYLMNAYISYLY